MEYLGYLSGLLLAICALPQVIKCIKTGNAKGLSKLFIWFWFLGEIGLLIFSINRLGYIGPLLLNYGANILFLLIIMKYMYFPIK